MKNATGTYFQRNEVAIILSHLSCHAPDNKNLLASSQRGRELTISVITQESVNFVKQPVSLVTTWHDHLVAGGALGGKLIAVAVAAHQRITLAGEGLVRQRAVAAETAETVCVVISVLIEELLWGEEEGVIQKLGYNTDHLDSDGCHHTGEKILNPPIKRHQKAL